MSNTTKNTASDMPSFSDKFTIKLTARQQQILELIQNSIVLKSLPNLVLNLPMHLKNI
jgi:hypothetical protein